MSHYTFECFVCPEKLETDDLQAVIDFGKRHKDCGEETS